MLHVCCDIDSEVQQRVRIHVLQMCCPPAHCMLMAVVNVTWLFC
jgi:hypothetical protein